MCRLVGRVTGRVKAALPRYEPRRSYEADGYEGSEHSELVHEGDEGDENRHVGYRRQDVEQEEEAGGIRHEDRRKASGRNRRRREGDQTDTKEAM